MIYNMQKYKRKNTICKAAYWAIPGAEFGERSLRYPESGQ